MKKRLRRERGLDMVGIALQESVAFIWSESILIGRRLFADEEAIETRAWP